MGIKNNQNTLKNILFVESYPHVFFGQQRTLLSLLANCASLDIKPLVAVTADGVFVDELEKRNFSVVKYVYPDSISTYGGLIYKTRGLKWLRMMQQIFTYILSIRRQLQDDLPDAVFCNDMRGLLTVGVAAKTLGLPVVIWDKLDKPHGWLDWFQLPLVTKNLIISSSVQVKYPIWQRKFFHNKIEKIFNGVDLMRFETSNCHPIRESLPGSYNDVLLAIVGSINARKGHDRIFSIWPKLLEVCPNLRLLVVGEASSAEDQQYLDGLPNKDNERVHFLGMRADVPNLMCSIDILLMPSRYEGMGQVSVEAMAAKVPVIGANAGGIPEVVLNDVTGLIVNADNPEEWVAAISRLASSSELRNQMGLAGSSRVEAEFNRPVQMAKVLKHCLDAIPSNQL